MSRSFSRMTVEEDDRGSRAEIGRVGEDAHDVADAQREGCCWRRARS